MLNESEKTDAPLSVEAAQETDTKDAAQWVVDKNVQPTSATTWSPEAIHKARRGITFHANGAVSFSHEHVAGRLQELMGAKDDARQTIKAAIAFIVLAFVLGIHPFLRESARGFMSFQGGVLVYSLFTFWRTKKAINEWLGRSRPPKIL